MIERLVVLVGVVIIVMAIGLAVQPTYENAVEGANNATTIDNETINSSPGTKTLAESNRDVVYQDQDQITVMQNNTTIQQTGNYTWSAASGQLDVLNSTTMNPNETANVTYGFTVPDGQQKLARDVTLFPAEIGTALTQILGAVMLLGSIMLVVKVVT